MKMPISGNSLIPLKMLFWEGQNARWLHQQRFFW
jgi:hypothetical protein